MKAFVSFDWPRNMGRHLLSLWGFLHASAAEPRGRQIWRTLRRTVVC